MKKTLIITVAITILLLAVLTWVYLFIYGTPQTTDDLFADLGFSLSPQPSNVVPTVEPEADQPLVDVAGVPLRQLTTRPVAGMVAPSTASSVVRYVERGTGHIYDIDLTTGAETRRTNTTIPRVVKAVFAETGESVALISETGYEVTTVVGTIDQDTTDASLSTVTLQPNARNVSFIDSETIHYTTVTNTGTTGYAFNFETNTQRELYRVPFWWVKSQVIDGEAFVVNQYAPELEGTVYQTSGSNLSPLLPSQFGFNALLTERWVIASAARNNTLINYADNRVTDAVVEQSLPIIPEKCVENRADQNSVFCAAPLASVPFDYPKSWYQGTIRSNDALWQVNVLQGSAVLLVDPLSAVGREVDVAAITTDTTASSLFLINKNDSTLWQYDLLAE